MAEIKCQYIKFIFFLILTQVFLTGKCVVTFSCEVWNIFANSAKRVKKKKKTQRTNGPVNAHLRPEIYTSINLFD